MISWIAIYFSWMEPSARIKHARLSLIWYLFSGNSRKINGTRYTLFVIDKTRSPEAQSADDINEVRFLSFCKRNNIISLGLELFHFHINTYVIFFKDQDIWCRLGVPSLHHKHHVVLFIFYYIFLLKTKDLNSIKKIHFFFNDVASRKTGNFTTH